MAAIYDRQPTDSPRSWEAFEIYRDLGAERSMSKVRSEMEQRAIRDGSDVSSVPRDRTIWGWSSKFNWQERVKAWDLDQAKVRQEESQRMKREQYQAELQRLQKTEQQLGQGLVSLGVDALRVLREIMKSPDFQAKMQEAPIGQISSLMGATQRVADSGVALYERSLGVDELLEQLGD